MYSIQNFLFHFFSRPTQWFGTQYMKQKSLNILSVEESHNYLNVLINSKIQPRKIYFPRYSDCNGD